MPPAADRRALKRQYREAGPAMGVYAIRNRASGRVVVRASLNLEGAMQRDRFELNLRGHRDKLLQAEWLRDGAGSFAFEVVDTLKKKPDDPPGHDYRDELAALLALWTEELADGSAAAPPAAAARQGRE
ncbi:MAG: GIY-YIG nuclease family protein [Rubrivivax sp.]|nr:GIY-YIG nuclease family protein [Rubrivivax sp.]